MSDLKLNAGDTEDVTEQLRRARIDRADADHTLGHLMDELADDPDGMVPARRTRLQIEVRVAEHRLYLWGNVVAVLEALLAKADAS